MSTTSETKKLVAEIGTSLTGLSKSLGTAKEEFETARKQAETVVRGSSTDVEQTLIAKMEQASERADAAKAAVVKAAEVCNDYLAQTL